MVLAKLGPPPPSKPGTRPRRQLEEVKAARLTLVEEQRDAPFSSSMTATSWWPSRAARWSGVYPEVVAALAEAPHCKSCWTMSTFPSRPEMCSAVWSSCRGRQPFSALGSSSPHASAAGGPNLGPGVHLGPVLQQVADHLGLAGSGRHVERRLPSLGGRRVGSVAERRGRGRSGQSTHHVGGVGRCSVVGQCVDYVLVAHEGCHMDGSQARLHRKESRSGDTQTRQEGGSGAAQAQWAGLWPSGVPR